MLMRMLGRAVKVLAIAGMPAAAMAGGEGWTENVDEALKTAQAEKKDVLMDFTGSDWCGWCIRLNNEVFSQEAFKSQAPQHFVMVELDFPNKKEQTEELKAQNAQWRDKFGVRGYPTIILADAKGVPYAQTGYQPGGPEAYVAHLEGLRKMRVARDEALAKAEKAQGVEKAKLLDEGMSALSSEIVLAHYAATLDEIEKLDADNAAGLKDKWRTNRKIAEVRGLMGARDLDGAMKLTDELLEKSKGEGQIGQDLYLIKSEILFNKGDRSAARDTLLLARKAAPQGNKVEMINGIFKRVFQEEPPAE